VGEEDLIYLCACLIGIIPYWGGQNFVVVVCNIRKQSQSIRYSAFHSIHTCSSFGMALRQLCRERDLHAVAVAFCSSCERGMLLRHERYEPAQSGLGGKKREERAKGRVYMYLFKLCLHYV